MSGLAATVPNVLPVATDGETAGSLASDYRGLLNLLSSKALESPDRETWQSLHEGRSSFTDIEPDDDFTVVWTRAVVGYVEVVLSTDSLATGAPGRQLPAFLASLCKDATAANRDDAARHLAQLFLEAAFWESVTEGRSMNRWLASGAELPETPLESAYESLIPARRQEITDEHNPDAWGSEGYISPGPEVPKLYLHDQFPEQLHQLKTRFDRRRLLDRQSEFLTRLSQTPEYIEEGFTPLLNEVYLGSGYVCDIFGRDRNGDKVLVEVKPEISREAIEEMERYLTLYTPGHGPLNDLVDRSDVRGDIKPVLADRMLNES